MRRLSLLAAVATLLIAAPAQAQDVDSREAGLYFVPCKPLPADQHRMIAPERNTVGNMMPACAPCNLSKGGYSLEEWRALLSRAHEIVAREKSIFRAAVRFGLITVVDQPVVFHFEAKHD